MSPFPVVVVAFGFNAHAWQMSAVFPYLVEGAPPAFGIIVKDQRFMFRGEDDELTEEWCDFIVAGASQASIPSG